MKTAHRLGLAGAVLAATAFLDGCTNNKPDNAAPTLANAAAYAPLAAFRLPVDKNHTEESTEVLMTTPTSTDVILADDDDGDERADTLIWNYRPGGHWTHIEYRKAGNPTYSPLFDRADRVIHDFLAGNPAYTTYAEYPAALQKAVRRQR